jgi:hypothetical protein
VAKSSCVVRNCPSAERRMVARERAGEVGYSEGAREQARQNAGVRRVCDWTWREGVSKTNPVFRQAVQSRGLAVLVAVAADMIRPKCVDRHTSGGKSGRCVGRSSAPRLNGPRPQINRARRTFTELRLAR